MNIKIPISVGELIDKITILQLKLRYSTNEYIQNELNELIRIAKHFNIYNPTYINDLYKVNEKLWDIEDKLRIKEKQQDFGYEFTELARNVYKYNDERATIKKRINEETNSEYKEIKIYG